jgi:hypothetical protein
LTAQTEVIGKRCGESFDLALDLLRGEIEKMETDVEGMKRR